MPREALGQHMLELSCENATVVINGLTCVTQRFEIIYVKLIYIYIYICKALYVGQVNSGLVLVRFMQG